MPSTGYITASGEGSQNLSAGANVAVLFILCWVSAITSAQVRTMGTTFPKRIQFAGSLQLQTFDVQPSGATTQSVVLSHSVSFEFEDIGNPYGAAGISANKIGWKLRPGVTCKINVFW